MTTQLETTAAVDARRSEEMPDPDNLRVDRFELPVLTAPLRPAPAFGERLTAPRHRA